MPSLYVGSIEIKTYLITCTNFKFPEHWEVPISNTVHHQRKRQQNCSKLRPVAVHFGWCSKHTNRRHHSKANI